MISSAAVLWVLLYFVIYSVLVPKITDVTILYSHKVLKVINPHLKLKYILYYNNWEYFTHSLSTDNTYWS